MRNLAIRFSRWPGQKMPKSIWNDGTSTYGWSRKSCGPMGRFGGGWRWKLGLLVGSKSIHMDLIYGSVTVLWYPPKDAR